MVFPTSTLFASKSKNVRQGMLYLIITQKKFRGKSLPCCCPQLLMRLVCPGGCANASSLSLAAYRFCCSELTSFALYLLNIFSSATLFPGERRHFHLYSSSSVLGTLSTLVCLSEVTSRTGNYCPKCCLHTL